MLTSIPEFLDPLYVPVMVEGTLEVEPYYFTEQVREQVQNAVRSLLAFEKVDFGELLYLSKVYEAVESTPGVGTTVRLTLPLISPEARRATA